MDALHKGIGESFLVLWAVWAIYWIVNASGNKQTAMRLSPVWRTTILTAGVLAYLARRYGPPWMNHHLWAFSWPRTEIGLALTVVGLAFTVWARRTLGTNWSANPTIKVGHELVRTGPYAWVRHPIYTGLLVAIFGSLLPTSRVGDLLVLAVTLVMLVIKLRIEEGLMRRQFPEAYPEYCRQTKALVPYIF